MKVSIVLCTYNEKNFIEKTLHLIKKKIKKVEIIIIDDNSSDGTLQKLNELKRKYKFNLFIRKKKRGLASALLMGLKKSNGNYVGFIDANMPDQINYFNKAIKKLDEGNDISVLSRYIKGGGDNRIFLRVITSFLINKVSKFVLRIPFNDFTSGIFLMKRQILKVINIKPFVHGEFFIDFIYRIHKKGLKIYEIPYVQQKDKIYVKSKSYPNIFRFAFLGIKYILVILNIKFKNNVS